MKKCKKHGINLDGQEQCPVCLANKKEQIVAREREKWPELLRSMEAGYLKVDEKGQCEMCGKQGKKFHVGTMSLCENCKEKLMAL